MRVGHARLCALDKEEDMVTTIGNCDAIAGPRLVVLKRLIAEQLVAAGSDDKGARKVIC